MKVFISIDGKQRGPFSLRNLLEMKELGSLADETLVRCGGEETWLPLDDFLTRHPVSSDEPASTRERATPRAPSRMRGLAGALLAGIVGGGVIAGLAAWTGALFTFLWWLLGWSCGAAAKSWARTHDQVIGLFACAATFLGIFISFAGLVSRTEPVILLGPLGFLISMVGSVWLAFRTGSLPP
jgi:hypothetical protein